MDRTSVWGLVAAAIVGAIIMRNQTSGDVHAALNNKNVRAFLAMIRRFESDNMYNRLFSETKGVVSTFADYSRHPDIKVPFHDSLRPPHEDGSANNFSTAAGAYQINWPTWLTIQAVAFLPDFSPRSQDLAAIWLLKLRGVLPDVIAGNFKAAIYKAGQTWASLPGSAAGQNPKSYNVALDAYTNYGGLQA